MAEYLIGENLLRAIRRVIRKVDNLRGDGVRNTPDSITITQPGESRTIDTQTPPHRVKITAIANDYLTTRPYDGTTTGTADVLVARPWCLQHVAAHYAGLTSLTTVNAQQVTATDGSTTETWKVTPSYQVGDEIEIRPVPVGGVVPTVGGVALAWIDANVDARAWAVEA